MKNKMYFVKKEGTEDYSMVGFVMWTNKGCELVEV